MSEIKVTLKRAEEAGAGQVLVIEIPLERAPQVSSSGKSIVIASSHGNVRTEAEWEGKPITIGLNAYVKNSM